MRSTRDPLRPANSITTKNFLCLENVTVGRGRLDLGGGGRGLGGAGNGSGSWPRLAHRAVCLIPLLCAVIGPPRGSTTPRPSES